MGSVTLPGDVRAWLLCHPLCLAKRIGNPPCYARSVAQFGLYIRNIHSAVPYLYCTAPKEAVFALVGAARICRGSSVGWQYAGSCGLPTLLRFKSHRNQRLSRVFGIFISKGLLTYQ